MIKRNIIILTIIAAAVASVLFSQLAFAEEPDKKCGSAGTSVIACDGADGQEVIFNVIKMVIQIMTAGVGVLAVGAVIYGAVLYSTSEGSPDKVSKARTIWVNTVIGMLCFAFMAALLNFLVPGGVF